MTDFQKKASVALAEETPNSEKLEELMEFGINLDVDLPEIPQLKQVGTYLLYSVVYCVSICTFPLVQQFIGGA